MSKDKGDILPASVQVQHITPKTKFTRKLRWITLSILSAVALVARYYIFPYEGKHSAFLAAPLNDAAAINELCPQVESQTPQKSAEFYAELNELYDTDEFTNRVVKWLSGAVRVPTESHDSMGPIDEDPRWEVFGRLHDYLLSAYPLIHTSLKITKVNTYGLVYHWQGTDESLKPLLLTAHQDVVPIDPVTVDQWIHPPYSGHWDGIYVWGRGSTDDKSGLISLMSAVETLLDGGFRPNRTIVLAFGFDEETSGLFGAYQIGEYLLQTYGENGFALLVDEGGTTINALGAKIIAPGTAEKGYLDVAIQVNTQGGHSSTPRKHTSIGILSGLLVALEENPPKPQLVREQTTYETIQCFVHAPEISKSLIRDIIRSQRSDRALKRLQKDILSVYPEMRYTLETTQAIDLIKGGVKVNALPEQATAVVNHRIDTASSVDAVKQRISSVLKPVVQEYNLSFTSFGEVLLTSSLGSVHAFDAFNNSLEPAPKTPTHGSAPWDILSSSIRAAIKESGIEKSLDKVIIAPGTMTGNTDTRYYWKLTPNIFRYGHRVRNNATYPGGSIHSVNEAMSGLAMVDYVRFFTTLILNTDESKQV